MIFKNKNKNKNKSLKDWLIDITGSHPKLMDLGLDRIQAVAHALDILKPNCPVITVTGTNGKGSCVATLERIYLAAGFKTLAFSSPHLWKINEEIRINGKNMMDQELIWAFENIKNSAQNISLSLTIFEYMALAALLLGQKDNVDILILEVGLGGRLDAVNIMDADLAVVTSIGLDHQAWLGNTREDIATQKAGIFRKNKPVVCGDALPPPILKEMARSLGCDFYQVHQNFEYQEFKDYWVWSSLKAGGQRLSLNDLPIPKIFLHNAATALMAIELLQGVLPVSVEHIHQGLKAVFLPGRYQIIKIIQENQQEITQIFDVGHNPQAAENLANRLKADFDAKPALDHASAVHAVFSMLGDKDILGVVNQMKDLINLWHIAPLETPRAAPVSQLLESLIAAGVSRDKIQVYPDIKMAYQEALALFNKPFNHAFNQPKNHKIIIFGSFYTVAAALEEPWQATAQP